jgi:hypothetical protein
MDVAAFLRQVDPLPTDCSGLRRERETQDREIMEASRRPLPPAERAFLRRVEPFEAVAAGAARKIS